MGKPPLAGTSDRWPYVPIHPAEVTKTINAGRLAQTKDRLVHDSSEGRTAVRARPKVGPNAPCPCGSGRKFKRCCGRWPAGRPKL